MQWLIYNMFKLNTEYIVNGQCRESDWTEGGNYNR